MRASASVNRFHFLLKALIWEAPNYINLQPFRCNKVILYHQRKKIKIPYTEASSEYPIIKLLERLFACDFISFLISVHQLSFISFSSSRIFIEAAQIYPPVEAKIKNLDQ